MKLSLLLKMSTVVVALAATFGTSTVSAKDLNAAVGLPPKNTVVLSYQKFSDYVAEHTDLDIKVFSMSLLSLKETSPGIREGLADLGFVLPVYYPAEFAESNLAANLSMLSTTGVQVENPGAAMAGAMTEYTYGCPECLAEYEEQRQVFLGNVASAAYVLLCSKPIETAEDLAGSKLRSGAPNFSRWAEKFGAVAVSISANDQYEALSQGVIDCTMAATSQLTNGSLADVTKFVTQRIPGGVFAGASTANFNVDVWQDLTDEERAVILRGMAQMQADMTYRYHSLAQKDTAAADSMGVKLLQPSDDLIAATDAFVQEDIKHIEQQFTADYGVENAEAKIAKVTALVEKWKVLTADVANDPEALAKIYWDEIFSKIDPTSYGLK